MSRRYPATVWGEARRWASSSVRNCSSASRTDRFRRELTLALEAAQHQARLARLLLDQERRRAVRARNHARPVPGRERALRVARAAVEGLAAARPALRDLALAALGALDPERDGLGELAVRSPRAGDEASVRAVARHQRGAAQVAGAVHRRRQLGVVHRPRELALRVAGARQERAAAAELLDQ